MSCSGPFATPDDFTNQWFYDFEVEQKTELGPILRTSAGRIHAAMAAQGMCDCSLAEWAVDYLKELNCVSAVVMFNLACVRLSPDQRKLFNTYLTDQLEQIRTGKIELCRGHTSMDAPAFGIASYGLTERTQAEIIANDIERNIAS